MIATEIQVDYYRQCHLVRKLPGEPTLRTTTWLPVEHALVDNHLKIQFDGKWIRGWCVQWISSTMLTGKLIDESVRDVAFTRIPPERIRMPNQTPIDKKSVDVLN